jgi:hypothetical protein
MNEWIAFGCGLYIGTIIGVVTMFCAWVHMKTGASDE